MDSKTSNRKSVHPRLQQAVTAMRERRYEEALATLKQITSDEPDHEVALGMLASAYAELGMRDRARQLFDEILKVNPGNPLARFQRGLMDFEDGRLESALELWRPLLADENDYMGHFHSALALMQLKQPTKARDLLVTAKERTPSNHPLASEATRLIRQLDNADP